MALKLPTLPRGVKLIAADGTATQQFQQWWQSLTRTIETQEGRQDELITALVEVNAATEAAQTAADTATTAAASAQTAADTTTAQTNLVDSYVDGTPPFLTATDAGANVTITVAAHNRVYGDATTLAITGGSVTGQPYSTLVYIYYVDATRADTTPTFLATTDASTAAQTGDTHLVGSVTTPAAAAPPETGNYVAAPGIGNLYEF